MSSFPDKEPRGQTVRIVAVYAFFGGLWICLSDSVLGWLIQNPSLMARLGMFKGLLFIALTSLLLYVLISRYAEQMTESNIRIRKNEDRFNRIYNGLSDAIFIHDSVTGRIVDVNQAACRMFGYTREEILNVGVGDLSLGVPPYSSREAFDRIRQATQGAPQIFEWQSRRRDGSLFWTEISMLLAQIGEEQQVIVTARDASERKQTEEKLRLSEEKFAKAFRITPDSVKITRMDGTYLEVNEGFCAMTGYSPVEVVGQKALDLEIWANPGDRKRLIDTMLAEGIVTRFEAVFRRKDGSTLIGQISARPIQVDGEDCILSITRDISAQKEAEELLLRQQQELRALLELMPVGVGWADQQGFFQYLNRNFVERFGYTVEDVPTVEELFQVAYPDPAYREKVKAVWHSDMEAARRNGQPVPPREADVCCRDGSVRHVIITTQLSPNRILFILVDITEREQIQAERVKSQKLESLGVLAGGIAHDFNNILTGIVGNISLAFMFLDDSHRAVKPLHEAEKAAARAAELARQLLTFAKGGKPVTEAVSCRQLVEESVSLVLSGSNVKAVIEIPDTIPALEVDAGQLSQVFNNLIINAKQAMPEGGTITIAAGLAVIGNDCTDPVRPGRYVRLSFGDTGCGIRAADQQKIFDPYFTTKPGGSGLGLASAHSIINRHGGHIAVQSSVPGGTTFTVLLPATEHRPAVVDVVRVNGESASKYEGSVLVMDDEELVRSVADGILTELGYQVTTCTSGEEAVELYRKVVENGRRYSAVLMDLTIPGSMGGKEAARRIREIDPFATLIVSSGYSHDPVMADYGDFGFRAAVSKPYRAQELSRVLQSVMHHPGTVPREGAS